MKERCGNSHAVICRTASGWMRVPSSLETAVESLWKRGFDVSERAAEDFTASESPSQEERVSVISSQYVLSSGVPA
ncbi:hypothetical protein TcBrA4_0034460 [Trypanosoma cruzi]|nr:hypothetical protein TcBrA4_0034460 [Trypanosoma cruzi]